MDTQPQRNTTDVPATPATGKGEPSAGAVAAAIGMAGLAGLFLLSRFIGKGAAENGPAASPSLERSMEAVRNCESAGWLPSRRS
jgi:hypothetical protein